MNFHRNLTSNWWGQLWPHPVELELTQPRKVTAWKKSQLILSKGVMKKGVVADDKDDGWEPIKLVTGLCDSYSGY